MTGLYEVIFALSGEVKLNIRGYDVAMSQKEFILIRPEDEYKKECIEGEFLSQSFPAKMYFELTEYLNCSDFEKKMAEKVYIEPVRLSNGEFLYLRERLSEMARLEAMNKANTPNLCTKKRILFFELIKKLWEREIVEKSEESNLNLPLWISETLKKWNNGENRQKGLEFFCEQTGFTKEHVCRSFKKYLGVSPTVYLNKQRLKHAVNLMGEGNYSMIEIAFEAGFKSSSRFYHVFKETYGVSPKQFYNGRTINQ